MRTRNKLATIVTVFLLALASGTSEGSSLCNDQWGERMQAEKIAYLTSAMDLTPSEAEKFWPVYNSLEKERRTAFGKMIKSYNALKESLDAGRPEHEISTLLDNYLKAVSESREAELKFAPKLREILSTEKVARLFIGEEEFRRAQIGKWHDREK